MSSALESALGAVKQYGPEDGLSMDDLDSYHYTFGMEYFDEPYELSSYDTHKQAVAAVEKGLAANTGGTNKVYRIDIPGTKQTLFGVGMAATRNLILQPCMHPVTLCQALILSMVGRRP